MGAQAVRLSNVDIDNALKNNNFEVLFQPIFDLGNGALARVETFVRWHHPQLGMLPPGAFISFFESQGRMSELTRFVLANALSAYNEWRGPYAPGLSVNLALSDLSDDAFASHFIKLLRDYNFPPDLVTLECPMPPVDMPINVASGHFKRLADTGARLAIEVRGRANDLLRTLDPFPFDEIKTGGSAILRFARTVRGPGLSAIADLLDIASTANAAITAVGVEDQASLSALRGLGFTAAQGNHLGKVGDIKEFRPHRINDVRELLGLEPLSAENLTALFRTAAPEPQTAAPADEAEASQPQPEQEDALIERLNERVARYDKAATAPEPEQSPTEEPAAKQVESDEDKKLKAREKAKALALAKRAKARAARKNAAIERAKTKAGLRTATENDDALFDDVTAASPVPRDMQEKLSRAFTAETPSSAEESAMTNAPEREQPTELDVQSPDTGSLLSDEPAVQKSAINADAQTREAASEKPAEVETPDLSATSQEQTPEAQPSQPRPTPFVGGMDKPVSLSVGAGSAYFLKGISVGSPALPGAPNTPIPPAELNIERSPMANSDDNNGAKPENAEQQPLSTVERAVASLSEEETPYIKSAEDEPTAEEETPIEVPAQEPQTAPSADETIGDLQNDLFENEDLTGAATRRRKPFLQRKVIRFSPYFWPRSWRRAMHQRNMDKLHKQSEEHATAAE